MVESNNQRQSSYSKPNNGYGIRGPYAQPISRASYNALYGMHQVQGNNDMAALTHGMSGLNVHDQTYNPAGRPATSAHYNGLSINTSIPSAYWTGNGQMMFPANQAYAASTQSHSPSIYTPGAAQYIAQGYAQAHDNSPLSQGWTPSQTTGELPTLITPRRDSNSSTDNDAPGTPSYGTYQSYSHGGVAIMNRSPNGTYATSTPSPLQVMTPYGPSAQKAPESETIEPRLQVLVRKEPAIPSAVPAPSSPLKPLDRALENHRGETNVYIRGLLPETSDETLEAWGKRFGDIKSSKSIIDHQTGLCKGYGFVRYHNYNDAEDCIRGFHHLGYEVSFARDSFYAKLKAIADDNNTNLYVSNLPKSMNEHELMSIFTPHEVCSARILRDKNGVGRGVGFARFKSRTVCDDVIKDFNNNNIQANGEEHTIQIRFADTQEQKSLKQTTAAARQFRSAEYEYAVQARKNGWFGGSSQQYSPVGQENAGNNNEFENYLGSGPNVPAQGQRWLQGTWRQLGRSPLATLPYNNNIRRNQTSMHANTGLKAQAFAQKDGGVPLKVDGGDPAIAHGDNSPTESAVSPD